MTMTPSGRRSTSMSRSIQCTLRKAGLVCAAACTFIAFLPERLCRPQSRCSDLVSATFLASARDVDWFAFLDEGADALLEILRPAAQHPIAVFHGDHGFDRAG